MPNRSNPYSRDNSLLRFAKATIGDPVNSMWWVLFNSSMEDDLHEDRDMRRRGMDPNFLWGANHRRAASAIEQTVNGVLTPENKAKVVFFTFTFPPAPRGMSAFKHANQCFRSASKRLFAGLFTHILRVLDVDERGCPHFHGIAIAKENIREGFDPVAYDQYMQRSREGATLRELRKLRRGVSTNPALRKIWQALDKGLQGHGFARLHGVFPIREYPEAAMGKLCRSKVGCYLARSYFRAVPAAKKCRHSKGVRIFGVSPKFPGKKRTADMVSPRWTAGLERLKKLFRFEENNQFKALLGRKWGVTVSRLLSALDTSLSKNELGQSWRDVELGTGAWLARVLGHLIEQDGFLHPARVLLPALQKLQDGYVPFKGEPRMQWWWLPVVPLETESEAGPSRRSSSESRFDFRRPQSSTLLSYESMPTEAAAA